MPFTEETMHVKKYNECIICDYLGVICDGPNLTSIDTPRFCEWCKLLRDKRGYANAKVAEISGVSLRTVERVMQGSATGLNGDTKSDIVCALVYGKPRDGSWGQHPCAMVALGLKGDVDLKSILEDQRTLREECCSLQQRLSEAEQSSVGAHALEDAQRKIDHLKRQITHHEEQAREKDKQLSDRHNYLRLKDRYIKIFLTTSGVSILGNIALLAWIISALL